MGISARRKARSLEFLGFAKSWARGAVAARLLCKQEAVGSNPTESILRAEFTGKIMRVSACRLKTACGRRKQDS